MKKLFSLFFFFLILFSLELNAQSRAKNDTQIIISGSWIYDALQNLQSQTKRIFFTQNQPMSVGEIKFYFNKIDFESLSDAGKKLYEKTEAALYSSQDFTPNHDLRLFANVTLSPEFYYKSNKNVEWSFDYCLENRFIEIPILFGFSDFATIESDFFLAKNYVAMQNPQNFTNIPYKSNHVEFYFPRFSYASAGFLFKNREGGINFHVGKEGLQLGSATLGSVVFNKTFETDFYSDLTFYTEYLKYSLKVSQVDNDSFLYLHSLDVRPFKNFRFSVIEGSLLNSSFQLRYLNPFMIMHQFASWQDDYAQMTPNEEKYYGEGYFCAYLAFTAEIIPFKNFRIYGLYAQNEILDLGGNRSDASLSVPDSLGGQLGFEYNFSLKNSLLQINFETIYTSPYLYVKQSPAWSLFRSRNSPNTDGPVNSWIGSPFGPDCFAFQLFSEYSPLSNWKISVGYLFKIHGENNATSLFSKNNYDEEKKIYNYYPSVLYELAEENRDEQKMLEAKNKGRYMWMTGIPEYTHQIAVSGSYSPFERLIFLGKFAYTFVFNNKNVSDNFQHGFELSFGLQYSLF